MYIWADGFHIAHKDMQFVWFSVSGLLDLDSYIV